MIQSKNSSQILLFRKDLLASAVKINSSLFNSGLKIIMIQSSISIEIYAKIHKRFLLIKELYLTSCQRNNLYQSKTYEIPFKLASVKN